MNELLGLISLCVLLFLCFSCIFIGFYLKYTTRPKLDMHKEFVIFLNERGVYWLYKSELGSNDCEPEQFVVRMALYNGRSCYWRKLNREWLKRIEQIGKI